MRKELVARARSGGARVVARITGARRNAREQVVLR